MPRASGTLVSAEVEGGTPSPPFFVKYSKNKG
jgi:hypothetical protein